MYLKRDIHSSVGGRLYGKAGEPVTIIGDHDTVMIVQVSTGARFPVQVEKLTDDLKEVDTTDCAPEVNKAPVKGKSKKSSSIQTLF